MARSTEERLQQIAEKVEQTYKGTGDANQKGHEGSEETLRKRKIAMMTTGERHGYKKREPSREFACHTV